MRVISGKFRSRPLLAPAGLDTRPTTDRLRETLFNVLTNGKVNRVEGATFLDLYAGSGAVGIEALSRGAASVTFVERGTAALAALQRNLGNLGLQARGNSGEVRVERRSVLQFLRSALERAAGSYDVAFLDPPYDSPEYELTLGLLGGECAALLAPGAMVVAEHRRKQELAASYGELARSRTLEQGETALSFYSIADRRSSSGQPDGISEIL